MPRRLLVLSIVLASFASGMARAAYLPAELLFNFADARIVESSGVAPATLTPGVTFTHNDSGDEPRFYAVGSSGELLATYNVTQVPRAFDWEDMARGPGPNGEPALFFADIGDNLIDRGMRPWINVYVVDEPRVDTSKTNRVFDAPLVAVRTLQYQDGPHNAETLLVDPASGRIAIVTKESNGVSGVFAAPAVTGIEPLLKVGSIDFNAIGSHGAQGATLATAGDVSLDGSKLVVRTYYEAFEWALHDFDLGAAVAGAPLRIPLPQTNLGEAIAYATDGRALITTSEGEHAPVYLLRHA